MNSDSFLTSQIGGLAAATSLRKAGHKVTIYERAHYAGEVGASISCAANGTRWLEEWGVNISLGRPVVLKKLILHDWENGDIQNVSILMLGLMAFNWLTHLGI